MHGYDMHTSNQPVLCTDNRRVITPEIPPAAINKISDQAIVDTECASRFKESATPIGCSNTL